MVPKAKRRSARRDDDNSEGGKYIWKEAATMLMPRGRLGSSHVSVIRATMPDKKAMKPAMHVEHSQGFLCDQIFSVCAIEWDRLSPEPRLARLNSFDLPASLKMQRRLRQVFRSQTNKGRAERKMREKISPNYQYYGK